MPEAATPDTTPAPPPVLLARLQRHFGRDPAELPVVALEVQMHERPNLHLALQDLLAEPDRAPGVVGVVSLDHYRSPSLAHLARASTAAHFDIGPVEHVDVPIGGGGQLACVRNGLYCLRDGGEPVTLLVYEDHFRFRSGIHVEAMAADRERAERFIRLVNRRTQHGKAFRGKVFSLEEDCHGALAIKFHALPQIGRDQLILPEAVLRRIERHSLSFTRHAERLRRAGRHLKRGILLHGAPGTGKTLTAMYLAAQMEGRTVVLLTGGAVGSIEAACRLARMLEPATLILEDVDLIGAEREGQEVRANALLFELLNQMDGLAEDADILFILTTNRPKYLEPALAARPGRIDQAIEVPLPDADCRRRLLELYSRGMRVELADLEKLIARTDGVSGAFLRELLRKAAVFAAEEDGSSELAVRDHHVDEALAELLVAGGPLTSSLLGVRNPASVQ
jgi:cell division protease FtsH